ncbi:Mediator of RNA polymerase II transcription subunit 25 [Morella rubra]|uniref:Mediator of RNA polymerase II transcription subunit 25 n=1 Tax=Morella rubra TaxID=262757 RepID=A0A6A1WBB8_9ROSI|nr:Mediator of RNA polymerase II transcription subunit 25 [Morella rubra]
MAGIEACKSCLKQFQEIRPAFSHIQSLAHAAFQGVPSLKTSLPSSASQEMITNNDNMQDLESIVSGVSQLLRPVGLAPASEGGVSGTQSLDGNNNAAANLPLSQQTSSSLQSALSKYVKVWEGNLSGQRQGQPVFITRLEGYRSSSASETQYVKGDFLVFRAMNPHGILSQLQEKKLCAVIQLPSQTLLLSVSDKACRLIGMLFPAVRF